MSWIVGSAVKQSPQLGPKSSGIGKSLEEDPEESLKSLRAASGNKLGFGSEDEYV